MQAWPEPTGPVVLSSTAMCKKCPGGANFDVDEEDAIPTWYSTSALLTLFLIRPRGGRARSTAGRGPWSTTLPTRTRSSSWSPVVCSTEMSTVLDTLAYNHDRCRILDRRRPPSRPFPCLGPSLFLAVCTFNHDNLGRGGSGDSVGKDGVSTAKGARKTGPVASQDDHVLRASSCRGPGRRRG